MSINGCLTRALSGGLENQSLGQLIVGDEHNYLLLLLPLLLVALVDVIIGSGVRHIAVHLSLLDSAPLSQERPFTSQ